MNVTDITKPIFIFQIFWGAEGVLPGETVMKVAEAKKNKINNNKSVCCMCVSVSVRALPGRTGLEPLMV